MTALTIAEMSAREVLRRRGVMLLLVLLPLSFYLVRRDLEGQSIRMLALGLGWAVSTVALFTGCAARAVEERLRVSGGSVTDLLGGRLAAMATAGVALGAAFLALVAVVQDVERLWAVGLLLGTTVMVAAPLGTMLAYLVPRELEGALALLTIVAVQMLADPAGSLAKVLPFWSTRELGTYAIDGTSADYLWRGLGHAAASVAVLGIGSVLLAAFRLRLAAPAGPAAAADATRDG